MRRFVLTLILALVVSYLGYIYWPRAVTETTIAHQLQGDQCRFAYELGQCIQRGLEPLRSLLVEDHDCDLWAVQCLSTFKTALAGETMLWVLEHKSDIETCDGVIPIRSYAIQYLGDFGDKSAIPALTRLKNSQPTARLSGGASGCLAKPENPQKIEAAIAKILSR